MSDDEMFEAIAYGIAGWVALFAFAGGLIWVLSRREEPEPVRFAPAPAMLEDESTAECEAILLPDGEWSAEAREGLRRMAGGIV